MPLPELDHTSSNEERTVGPYATAEEEDWPVAPLRISDGKKHRCHVCHLHVIPGLPAGSILGGQLREDGRWEHFRCR